MIKYRNLQGDYISEQELESNAYYIEVIFVDNQERITKHYENKKLILIGYKLTREEKFEDFLDYSLERKIFVSKTTIYDSCKLIETIHVFKREVTINSLSVYNKQGNLICTQNKNFYTQKRNLLSTHKYYYDENGKEKFSFDYNVDGTPFLIYDSQNFQNDILASMVGTDDTIDFKSWKGYEYYKDANRLFP